jgi:hypothetical protein
MLRFVEGERVVTRFDPYNIGDFEDRLEANSFFSNVSSGVLRVWSGFGTASSSTYGSNIPPAEANFIAIKAETSIMVCNI